MKTKILKQVENDFDNLIDSIIKVSSIDSRPMAAKSDAPFGEGIKKCLAEALKISHSLGFEVENCGNQVGVASTGVDSEEYVAMIGHLDVVDLNGHWNYPPFEPTIVDGKIIARGVLDNKGPIMSCLYALKALKDCGYEFPCKVKVMFGTNEESGMEDMKWYFKEHPYPTYGWTPDCKYPVVYAERGRAVFEYYTDKSNLDNFLSFVTTNILNKTDLSKALNVEFHDAEFGINQVRNIALKHQSDELVCQVVVSYPASLKLKDLEKGLASCCANGINLRLSSNLDAVFFPKDSYLVKTLEKSYEEVCGNDGSAVTTTGGTYAKVIKNIVPFGPSFPNQKGIGHLPDEWMNIDDILMNTKIYAISLYNLLEGLKV